MKLYSLTARTTGGEVFFRHRRDMRSGKEPVLT